MKKLTKKTFTLLLSLALLAAVIPASPLPAAAKTSGDYEYEVIDETAKTCQITLYTGFGGDIVIPSKLDGYTVTEINGYYDGWDYGAFGSCTSLTSVTIPDSVTYIDWYAFQGCTSLTSVTIPDSVTLIGSGAFLGCTSLPAINVDEANTAYTSKSGVLFTKDMKTLHTYPGDKPDTAYVIPDSVTEISRSAFGDCTSLTSVTIPNSVTEIGWYAFCGCTSLTSVTIPDSVTSIGRYAFGGCTSLTAIDVDTANTVFASHEGVLYNKEMTEVITCPEGKTGSYITPNSVTKICQFAFADCTSLTSVTIGNSVTTIDWGAFDGCAYLPAINVDEANTAYTSKNGVLFTKDMKTLHTYPAGKPGATYVIPYSVTTIGDCAFKNCTSLTSVTIPDSVTTISGDAFSGCKSLTSVTIPDSVTEIGQFAFSGCTSLTSVTIPNSVTKIYMGAFSDCTSLTSVTIPSSVKLYHEDAFDGCTALTDIYYAGTEAQWRAIEVGSFSGPQHNAAIHYNCASSGIKKGDVTGDGVVDNMDAAKILKFDAGLIRVTDALLAAGDVTGDGVVDNMDAAKILKFDAGLISSL